MIADLLNDISRCQTAILRTSHVDRFQNAKPACTRKSCMPLVVCLPFYIIFFRNMLSGIPSGCQIVWIKIRPDVLSGLNWVLTVLQR